MDWAHFSEYGLVGTIVGVLFFILWRIIVYTMQFVSKITDQQSKERESWQLMLASHQDVIRSIAESIRLHHQQSDEAHRTLRDGQSYQRQEHEKMIGNLNEIAITLGRINGYKHD